DSVRPTEKIGFFEFTMGWSYLSLVTMLRVTESTVHSLHRFLVVLGKPLKHLFNIIVKLNLAVGRKFFYSTHILKNVLHQRFEFKHTLIRRRIKIPFSC